MDRYTKFILTVITIALSIIAIRLSEIPKANANVFSQGPTLGDIIALREIKDPIKLKEARTRLLHRIPLVRFQGGQVNVSGSVEIDN